MFNRRFLYAALTSTLALLFQANMIAQSEGRPQATKENSSPKKELNEKEKLLAELPVKDQAKFAKFLKQPDTGLIRLLPRDIYEDNGAIRGPANYSFTRLRHGYDIEIHAVPVNEYTPPLIREYTLRMGHGLLTVLGNVPLEKVTLEHKGVKFLDAYNPPSTAAELSAEERRSRYGIDKNGYGYSRAALITVNFTYALRSINYGQSDVLVSFRVVRKEIDGSVVILWKMLKQFHAPPLFR
jgi:hypothetical protein